MDERHRIAALIDDSAIRAQIYDRRTKAAGTFDNENGDLIQALEVDFGNVYRLIAYSVIYRDDLNLACELEAFALFNRSWETLISAFHLVRQGDSSASFALLRIAVEAACCAAHITGDPEAWKQFCTPRLGRYKSTSAVRFACRHVPRIHKFWTQLSQIYLHPNRLAFGSEPSEESGLRVTVGGRKPSPEESILALLTVSAATGMVLKMMEVVLLEQDPAHPGMLRIPGTSIPVPPSADQLIANRFQVVEDLWNNG